MALRLRQLTPDEVRWFWQLAKSDQTPRRLVLRASIIWLAAQGSLVPAIASQVGVSEHTVRLWITRFGELGQCGLDDLPRPGAKRKLTDSIVEEIRCLAAQTAAQVEERWTLDRLVAYVGTTHSVTISRSRVNQIVLQVRGSTTADYELQPVT